jgi:hypothetical protein
MNDDVAAVMTGQDHSGDVRRRNLKTTGRKRCYGYANDVDMPHVSGAARARLVGPFRVQRALDSWTLAGSRWNSGVDVGYPGGGGGTGGIPGLLIRSHLVRLA